MQPLIFLQKEGRRRLPKLDSEMEPILCFDSSLDTETFCSMKSAIFIALPEEDNTKYFMVSLFLQQLY